MGTKFRLYPEEEVEATFCEWMGQERLLHNMAVSQYEFALTHRAYAARPNEAVVIGREHWPSHLERSKQLTELRKELDWLKAGSRKVQTQALVLVDQSYRNWWKNPGHFHRPTYRKKSGTQGFSVVGRGADFDVVKLNRKWGAVRFPKVGMVKFRLSVPFSRLEEAKSCRVTRDKAGRWWVSFPGAQPAVERVPSGFAVGLDMGVVTTVATSDGEQLCMPELSSPGVARRKKLLQRKLSRQQKGSRRRERTRRSLAKLSAREAARRRDWVEKTTTQLVRDHDVVVMEDLKVVNMLGTPEPKEDPEHPGTYLPNGASAKAGLNRSIQRQSWGAFRTRLAQKAQASGVTVIAVNPAFTSQRCSACGDTRKENRESQAVFSCRACGHHDNADVNAAKNILAAGLAVNGRGGELQQETAEGDPMKRQLPGVLAA